MFDDGLCREIVSVPIEDSRSKGAGFFLDNTAINVANLPGLPPLILLHFLFLSSNIFLAFANNAGEHGDCACTEVYTTLLKASAQAKVAVTKKLIFIFASTLFCLC